MKKPLLVITVLLLLMIPVYTLTGLFVIQPLGSIPKGMTIWYIRSELNLPFISSPDGILLDKQGSVSLLGRSIVLGDIGTLVLEKEIARFGYFEKLYLITTDGVKFEK